MATRLNRKFSQEFIKHMRDCDYNYRRMLKLLPKIHERQQWCYVLDDSEAQISIRFEVLEHSVYTQVIEISMQSHSPCAFMYVPEQAIIVRLYHDAHTAEVLNDFNYKPIASTFNYPNMSMYQVDEKLQRNCFLSSLLKHLLEFAYVANDSISSPKNYKS